MNIDELLGLGCEERYDYCLLNVVEEREIWILVNDNSEFLKLYSEEGGFEYLPIWPSSALAEHYAKSTGDLKPKAISLPEFLKKWIKGLHNDDLDIGVFPGSDETIWLMSPEEFKQDLEQELSAI